MGLPLGLLQHTEWSQFHAQVNFYPSVGKLVFINIRTILQVNTPNLKSFRAFKTHPKQGLESHQNRDWNHIQNRDWNHIQNRDWNHIQNMDWNHLIHKLYNYYLYIYFGILHTQSTQLLLAYFFCILHTQSIQLLLVHFIILLSCWSCKPHMKTCIEPTSLYVRLTSSTASLLNTPSFLLAKIYSILATILLTIISLWLLRNYIAFHHWDPKDNPFPYHLLRLPHWILIFLRLIYTFLPYMHICKILYHEVRIFSN